MNESENDNKTPPITPVDGDGDQKPQEPEFVIQIRYRPVSKQINVSVPPLDKVFLFGMLSLAQATLMQGEKKEKQPLVVSAAEFMRRGLRKL